MCTLTCTWNQYTQVQVHTPVKIMQNTELQIYLSAMNTSIHFFIHSGGWRLYPIPSFSVQFPPFSGEQNTALQKKIHWKKFACIKFVTCQKQQLCIESTMNVTEPLLQHSLVCKLKLLLTSKTHHRSGEVIVSNRGKNIFFPSHQKQLTVAHERMQAANSFSTTSNISSTHLHTLKVL